MVAEAEARVLLSVQARADAGDEEASKLLESMLEEADGSATGGAAGAGGAGGAADGADDAEIAEMLGEMFGGGTLRDETNLARTRTLAPAPAPALAPALALALAPTR